jgi:hypothetical protein
MLRSNNEKTQYELWKGRLNDRVGKFNYRVDKGILVGYSSKRKEYKFYNLRLNKIVESINVKIDETGALKIKEERENLNNKKQMKRKNKKR